MICWYDDSSRNALIFLVILYKEIYLDKEVLHKYEGRSIGARGNINST